MNDANLGSFPQLLVCKGCGEHLNRTFGEVELKLARHVPGAGRSING